MVLWIKSDKEIYTILSWIGEINDYDIYMDMNPHKVNKSMDN